MSSPLPKIVPTNLPMDLLVMDDRVDGKDEHYYCLPPFYGTPGVARSAGGGYPFHLVSQGHRVGIHDNWLEAKQSVSGFPDSAHRGYYSVEECIDAWQRLCPLGVHPHPVDPTVATPTSLARTPTRDTAQFVNTSPRKADLKREASPLPSASTSGSASASRNHVNFAIRGDGIVSSSALRSQQRYIEMQRRGEEPDMLVTRDLLYASIFALEDEERGPEVEVEGEY